MGEHGFKRLAINNWLEPDEISTLFVRVSPDGQKQPLTGDDWANQILAPVLIDSVPDGVKSLYEVARAALMYGYFFYPLYTLAVEQLFRVAEAAVAHKCGAISAPASCNTLKKQIDWLVGKGVIQHDVGPRWHTLRHLRNSASHPESQTILPPGPAVGILEQVAEDINSLFKA